MLPEIFSVSSHSQRCGKGSTFVAIAGLSEDGCNYIEDALNRGATKIVVSREVHIKDALLARIKRDHIKLVYVDNTRLALAQLSAQAAGDPAKQLKLIGITGTKGKTTTTFMTHEILKQAGYKTAMISTVQNSIGDHIFETNMTTPQPDYLHQFFAQCVQKDVEYVVMEVAAQAMTFDRIAGLKFAVVAFMNLEREHGELYETMPDYYKAKKNLFDHVDSKSISIVNADDAYGARLIGELCENGVYCKSISMCDMQADYFGTCAPSKEYSNVWHMDIQKKENNAHLSVDYEKFHGVFNGYNSMIAVAIADACGVPLSTCARAIQTFPTIPGRFERYVLASGAHVIIDYAHTPASFEALFETVRPMAQYLIVVFGAGGGKDPAKRPLMGTVSARYADRVIITSDNPRFEDLQNIIHDIIAKISLHDLDTKVSIITDREAAIVAALHNAQTGTYILLLGKGPDEYQLVNGHKTAFSEKEIVKRYI